MESKIPKVVGEMDTAHHYEYEEIVRIHQLLPIIESYFLVSKHKAKSSNKDFLKGTFEPLQYPKMVKSKDQGYQKYGLFVEVVLAEILKNRYQKKFVGTIDQNFLKLFPEDSDTLEECLKTADEIGNLYPADGKTTIYYQKSIDYTSFHGIIQGHPDFIIVRNTGGERKVHILDCKVFKDFNPRNRDGTYIRNQLIAYYVMCICNLSDGELIGDIGLITPRCEKKIYKYSPPLKFGEEEAWLELLKQSHLIHSQNLILEDIWNKRILEYNIGKHVRKEHLPIFLGRGMPLQIMLHGNVQTKIQDGSLYKSKIPDLSKSRVYIHGPYNLNLAKLDEYIWRSCVDYFKEAAHYGFRGVVFHCGSNPDREQGIINMKVNLQKILEATEPFIEESPFILETSCGEGNEVLVSPEELREFVSQFSPMKVALCVDTCHVYVAGYQPMDFIKRLGPEKQRINLIHFNGTNKDMHSCCDRHHHIKQMQNIPDEELMGVLEFSREHDVDCVIE